jgi:hypothetical protein
MNKKITALAVGIAALTAISTTAATVAEAADGCGSGMYYNGRRCVPKDDFGFRVREPGYRPYQRDRGVSLDLGPGLRLNFGGGNGLRFR